MRLHPEPCPSWNRPPRGKTRYWLEPVQAQLRGIDVSAATIARIVAVLSEPAPQDDLGPQRRERLRRELALDYAAGHLDEQAFLSGVAALVAEPDRPAPAPVVSAEDVTHYPSDLAESLRVMDELVATGGLDEHARTEWWAKMIGAVYTRLTVAGTTFVEAKLSPATERHGLALALPEDVRVWSGGPDRIRTGDLQRDRLACWAATPRAPLR